MAAKIVFENADGTITHRIPAMRNRLRDPETGEWVESLDDFVERTAQRNAPPGSRRLPGNVKLPIRYFRQCWRAVGDTVQVDMPLAREQRMAEIRQERDNQLVGVDVEINKSNDKGDSARTILLQAIRQQIRDIPATIDLESITDPEDLEKFEPDWPVSP